MTELLEQRRLFAVQLATWSDSFVDSIGVNVAGVTNSAAVPLLSNLGIRYVRAGDDLAATPSMKGVVIADYATSGSDAKLVVTQANALSQLANIKANNNQSQVIAVEGPDEYDGKHGSDTTWAANARAWDKLVSTDMRADPWFNGIPYIGTSLAAYTNFSQLGDESAFTDAANVHPYPGAGPSSAAGTAGFTTASNDTSDGNPLWATETGYSTGTGTNQEDATIGGRYMPDMLLNQYNEGYQKTFIYDLADKTTAGDYDGSLGLYTNGGAAIKPAGSAVKNLISVLGDSQSTPFRAGGLDYTTSTLPADVHTTLLEKADGTFYLAYWREMTSVDAVSSAENVTLTVNTPVNTSASVYTPNVSATPTTVTLSGGATTLAVTDQLQIIQLTPSGTAPTVPAAPSAVTIASTTGSHRATISWTDNASNEDGFVIDRLGPDDQWVTLGHTAANVTTFADSSIVPGDVYGYRVTAVNRSGGSTPATNNFTAPTAVSIDDPLADFTYTTAGATTPPNWQIIAASSSGNNNSPMDNDAFVAAPTVTTAQSLTYKETGAEDFLATVYMHNNLNSTNATFATSPDGVTFTTVTTTVAQTTTVTGFNYNVLFYRPAAVLPAGTNYVRVTFTGSTQIDLGDMRIVSAAMNGADVGAPSMAGSTSYSAGTYTLTGGGSDIWSTADQFQFASTPLAGDGSVVAKLTTLTNTNAATKGGIMIRATTDTASPYFGLLIEPNGNVLQQWRLTSGASTSQTSVAETIPQWLRITRTGNSFTGYYSSDGVNWTAMGAAVTVALPTPALAGLALTSHTNNATATATFTNVAVGQGVATLNRTGWTASASNSNGNVPPSNALDGSASTRWGSGTQQTAGMWFQLDLGAATSFSRINLATPANATDFPASFSVYVSDNGTDWSSQSAIYTGTGTGPTTDIVLPSTETHRYVRIVLNTTLTTGVWWSIGEINLLA